MGPRSARKSQSTPCWREVRARRKWLLSAVAGSWSPGLAAIWRATAAARRCLRRYSRPMAPSSAARFWSTRSPQAIRATQAYPRWPMGPSSLHGPMKPMPSPRTMAPARSARRFSMPPACALAAKSRSRTTPQESRSVLTSSAWRTVAFRSAGPNPPGSAPTCKHKLNCALTMPILCRRSPRELQRLA